MVKKIYKVKGKVWLYPGENSAWHFVSVPKKESEELRNSFHTKAKGWGSLPVEVKIGNTKWATSIFPDKKSSTYLLPLKLSIRIKESIREGDTINFQLHIKV